MLDNLPMELATIIEDMARSAYERGLQVGEQRVMKGLSAVAHLNGSANRILKALPADDIDTTLANDPKPGAPHDDEPADVHAAVIQAMIEHAEQSINNGEDPTDGVHALLDLLDDPDQLAEVLGTKNDAETVQKSLYWMVLKSWSEDLHPRDDNGRFVGKDKLQEAKSDPKVAAELRKRVTKPEQRAKLDKIISGEADPGRTKRGQAKHEAGQRRQAKRLASLEAKRLVGKIMDGAGTAEDVEAIAGHINSGLNRDQIGYLGVLAQQAKGGGRRREEMVSALLDHVRGIVTPKEPVEPDTDTTGRRVEPDLGGDERADVVGTDVGEIPAGKPRSQEQGGSGMQRMKQQTADAAAAAAQQPAEQTAEQQPSGEDLHAKVLESLNHPLKWREGEVLPQAATPRKMIDNAHAVSGGNSRYSAMARMTTDQGWTTDGKYAVRSTPEMIEQAKKKGFDKLEGRIPVMDDVIPTKGYVQPASIVAHRLDHNGKHVVMIQGDEKAKNQQIADANYIANIRSIYPNATMHVHDSGMVIFKDNGQNVGIVMPMTGVDTSKIAPETSKPQEMSEYLEPSPYGAESVRRVHNGLQFHGANIQITGSSKAGYEVPQYTGRTFATYQQAENFAREMLSYAHGADENGKLIFKPKGEQTELQGTDKDKKEYYQQLREKIQQTKPIKREKVTVTGHDGKEVERDLIHLNDHFAIRQDTPSFRDKNPKGYTVIHTPTGDTVSTGWGTQKDAIGHAHVLGGIGVDWGNWDSGKMKAESPEEFERVKQRFANATTAYENDDYHPDMATQQPAASPIQLAESPGSQLGKKLNQHMTDTIAKLNAGDPDIGTGHKDLISEIAAKHGKQGLIDAALAYDETKPHEEERQRKMFGRMSQDQLAKHLHDSTQGRIDTMFRLAAGGEDIPLTHELMRRAAARQQQPTPTPTGVSDNAMTAETVKPAPAPVPVQSINDADVKNRTQYGANVSHNGMAQILSPTIAEGGEKYKKGHVEVAVYRGEHGGKKVYRWQENRDGNHQTPANAGQWSESHAQTIQDAYDHAKANVPDAKISDEKFHRQFGDESTRAQIAKSDAVKSAAAEQSRKQQAEKVNAMMKLMKKVKTSQGERYLHEFEADKGFWDNGHKKHGMDFVYPKKDPDGVWRVKIWGQTPQQTQQAIDKLKSMGAYSPSDPTPTPAPTPAPAPAPAPTPVEDRR